MKTKYIDALLLGIATGAIIFLFFASESNRPFASGFLALRWPYYNDALLNVAAGFIASIFFYYLLVRIPLYAQRKRLRKALIQFYNEMRVAILQNLLTAVKQQTVDVQELASNPNQFRELFKTGDCSSSKEGWYAAVNSLNEYVVKEIKFELQVFRDELHYVLDKIDIEEEELSKLLKTLSVNILRMDQLGGNDHDDIKVWSRFLWSLYTFRWESGYLNYDPILKMLSEI